MKRFLVIFLVAAVSAALFAGGAQNAPAAAAGSGNLTEISYLVWDRGTVPPDQGTITDNWWTKYVDQKVAPLGAKMKYIAIPRAQEAQLLSTMLAANNAPDISKTNELPLLMTYLSGGGITDITSLVDSSGPNIKALLGPDVLADIKYAGKIYWIPHMQNGMEVRTTWIRKDWLDAVGMAVPATPDEFYQVLKAIKAKDPGGRGSSLIPLGIAGSPTAPLAYFDSVVLSGFITTPMTPQKLLTPYPMWPETKDALRYLNKLYAEGLLTDIFVTDKDESVFRQTIARGDMFSFIAPGHYVYHSAYGELYDKLRQTTPSAVLANINTFRPTATSPRNEYRTSNPTYGYRFFVPASSKNAALTVKVLNFLSSEDGYLVGGLGIPGVDYTMVNNIPTPIDRDKYLARVPWIEPQFGLMAKPFARPQDKDLFLTNYIKDFNPAYYDQIRKEVSFLSDTKWFPPTISAPTPVSDKLMPIVTDSWNNALAKIVYEPQANFDKTFDDAIKEYKSLGGDAIVDEAQKLYAQQER